MSQCLVFAVFCSDVLIYISGKYGTKLSNARGDLVQLINVNAFFLSCIMYGEVLSQDKKRVIQSVREVVSKLFCLTGALNTQTYLRIFCSLS